jgi:hypothetical protein
MALQLTPLAVALQGIGYGSFLTAVQGLAVIEDTVQPPIITLLPQGGNARFRPKRQVSRFRRLPPQPAPASDTDEDELALQLLGMI